jgi:hypothetical protein
MLPLRFISTDKFALVIAINFSIFVLVLYMREQDTTWMQMSLIKSSTVAVPFFCIL